MIDLFLDCVRICNRVEILKPKLVCMRISSLKLEAQVLLIKECISLVKVSLSINDLYAGIHLNKVELTWFEKEILT